ncbi:unnamed protein product [Lactuca saligna]|uniref:PB1-like domain-containing protein n=1 Tax=Lactuca saligna TaxID=75948 RepID=A0AA35VNW1_LACSI|nr:unnamed protein product [Lactuca saligna]
MVLWRIRANMEEIDVGRHYLVYFTGGHPTIFSIRLYHGGEFTKFPGRKYIKGKQTYVDLLDMDTFSVHDTDEMMEQLGYVDEEANVMDRTGNDNMDLTVIDNGDNNKEENPCAEVEIGDKFKHTNEVEFRDGNKDGEDPCAEFESEDMFEDINKEEFGSRENFDDDSGYESSESDDIDFYVDNDNILDDVEVDMNDFNDNIDIDAEWVGSMNDNVVQEENEVGELNEVLNNEGTIPKLGSLDNSGEGQQEVNNEDEEKCLWSLYASKWKCDINWMVKYYNKEHRCLQTHNVKACTYKFLAKNIATQVESNPTIPIRALQEQLQCDYQVGLSKMKVFRDRTEALNRVQGDYVVQYALLRDYVLELQKHNPDTTVKIDVESEPNPTKETRTFMCIYICLGPLKRDLLLEEETFLVRWCFYEGSIPRTRIDGNNGTYPLAYIVVESESTNSWTWFLTCLGDDLGLGTNSNFTFMTDRQKFQRSMEELRKLNNDAYKWLKNIHPQHWSRSHFTGRAHTDVMLNNMCESLNSKIVEGRDVPIITCLDYIREYLMKKIVTMQKEIDKVVGPLTPTATIWVGKLKKGDTQLRYVFCGNGKYKGQKAGGSQTSRNISGSQTSKNVGAAGCAKVKAGSEKVKAGGSQTSRNVGGAGSAKVKDRSAKVKAGVSKNGKGVP